MPPVTATRPRPLVLLGLLGLLALALVVGGLLVVRHSGDDAPAEGADGAPELPSISATWNAEPAVAGADRSPLVSVSARLTTPEQLVVTSSEGLVAVDTATGERRWRAPLGLTCAASDVASDGTVALTVRPAGAYDCRRLVLLDTATGKVRWSATTPAGQNYARVVITPRSVLFHADCRPWRRFDRETGRVLTPPAPGNSCDGAGLSPEVLAVTTTRGRYDTPSGVALLDADSGRRIATVRGYGGDRTLDVRDVVSTDPLVLDVAHQGHRLLRQYDERGRPVRYLGYQQDTNPNGAHTLLGVVDGVMVVSYTYLGLTTYGLDLATGEVLWALGQEESSRVLGLQGSDLVMTARYGNDTVLIRAPVTDPDAVEVLGVLEGAPSGGTGVGVLPTAAFGPNATLAGDRVLVATDDGTAAYPVPAAGEPAAEPATAAALDALAAEAPGVETQWADDDLRPGDSRGCDDVSPRVFRLLKWGAAARLPRSATCSWLHYNTSGDRSYWYSRVEVTVSTVAPTIDPTDPTADPVPASEAAAQQLAKVREGRGTAIPGVGDEAWIARRTALGDREVRVWMRLHNRVWSIRVMAERDSYPDAPVPPPSASAIDAAVQRLMVDVGGPDGLVVPDRLPGAPR